MTLYFCFLRKYVYTKENIVKLIIMNLSILLISISSLFIPFFSKSIVDGIMIDTNTYNITKIFILFISLIVISTIIGIFESRFTSALIENVSMKCRNDIYNTLMLSENELESGKELFKIFSDISVICNISIQMPTNLIITLVILLTANVLLYHQNVLSLILINFCLLINIILYSLYYKKMKILVDKYQNVYSNEYENIKQLIDRKPLVEAFSTINQENINFNDSSARIRNISVAKNKVLLLFSNVFSSLSTIFSILILYIGFLLIKLGKYSLGDVIVLNSFLSLLIPYTKRLIDICNQYPALLISLKRVEQDLRRKCEDDNAQLFKGNDDLKEIDIIEFHRLNFSYEDKEVFNNFNLVINLVAFKLILLKGKSGIGKSTLLRIISNHFHVNSMYINGQHSDLFNLKKNIGYYHNSHRLIKGTIMDNVRYGNTEASMDDVIHICKIVCIHETIEQKCDNYYSYVDPNYETFSSGEEQRICLARTFLKNANIYLLDEPFSNLDIETARKIILNLKVNNFKCLIVSHNYKSVNDFDSVISI